MCRREDFMLATKEIPLCGGRDRGVVKIWIFFQYKLSWENYRFMRKVSMRFKRIWVHKYFFQSKMVLDIPEDEEKDDLEETTSTNQIVDRMKGTDQPV